MIGTYGLAAHGTTQCATPLTPSSSLARALLLLLAAWMSADGRRTTLPCS